MYFFNTAGDSLKGPTDYSEIKRYLHHIDIIGIINA